MTYKKGLLSFLVNDQRAQTPKRHAVCIQCRRAELDYYTVVQTKWGRARRVLDLEFILGSAYTEAAKDLSNDL
jgi:hypothetical protein